MTSRSNTLPVSSTLRVSSALPVSSSHSVSGSIPWFVLGSFLHLVQIGGSGQGRVKDFGLKTLYSRPSVRLRPFGSPFQGRPKGLPKGRKRTSERTL